MGKTLVRGADALVNLVILVAVVLMIFVGGYSLWDSKQVYDQAASSNWSIYKPSNDPYDEVTFQELRDVNPEIRAWLEVYGTDIDYPVAQGTDNMKYVNTDGKGGYSLAGCPFLDYENAPDFSDFNSIIYGHHMDVPAMFGELDRFNAPDYFASHEYGTLFHDGVMYGITFFASLECNASDTTIYHPGIATVSGQQEYLDYLYSHARASRDVGVTTSDKIVVLSTCSTEETNGRYILAGVVTDEVHPNPFSVEEEAGSEDWSIWDWLRMVPWWLWLLLVGIIGAVVVRTVRARRRVPSAKHASGEKAS